MASITVTTGDAQRSAHITYRITGHENPATQAPEDSASNTAANTNPDPDSLTPTGGAKNYLWLAIEGHDQPETTDGFPTDYINTLSSNGASAEGVGVGSAERDLNASSEDPGTFTLSASARWVGLTVAIHPVSAVPIVQATNTSLEDAANVTEHTVNLPAGISSGDLLIIIFGKDSNSSITFPAGYTQFFNRGPTVAFRIAMAYRQADGTEEGATPIIERVPSHVLSRPAHHSIKVVPY